jgi:hypothetical protein
LGISAAAFTGVVGRKPGGTANARASSLLLTVGVGVVRACSAIACSWVSGCG